MPIHQAQLSFNGGELSPYLHYRNDFAKHSGGAAKMRNFLPLPFGSFSKRPGTEWLCETVAGGLNSRAFPFTASDGTQYVLHFTPEVLTIYRKDGTVAATLDFMECIEWGEFSWDTSIRAMQMIQVNDTAFFTHPWFHPLRLTTTADTAWELDFVPFVEPPMLDENLDEYKRLSVVSNPVASVWVDALAYNQGDIVFENSTEWECTEDHTSDTGDNKPGSGTDWRDFWTRKLYLAGDPITINAKDRSIEPWAALPITYGIGDLRTFTLAGASFDPEQDYVIISLTEHPADEDSFAFGTVTSYGNYELGHPSHDGISTWWLVRAYDDGDVSFYLEGSAAHYNGVIYRCLSYNETANNGLGTGRAEAEPGIGSAWATFWEVVYDLPVSPLPWRGGGIYYVGDERSVSGRKYRCIVEHEARDMYTDEWRPGTGTDWQDIWEEISVFIDTFGVTCRSPGSYWKVAPERDSKDFQIEMTAIIANDGKFTDSIVVDGGWNLFTFGTWHGIWHVQRSIDNGATWDTIRSYSAEGDRNIAESGEEDSPVRLRLKFEKSDDTAAGGKQRALLVPESASVTGYALMTEYVDAQEMTGFALSPMLSGSTSHWAKGAFDENQGFPRALTLHERSLWFAGTVARPVSYWKSRIDDFTNFEVSTLDDGAIYGTLATGSQHTIRWLASTRRLFIGTAMGEWVAGSETADLPITPTNFTLREYTPHGSCQHQPLKIHDGLFMLGRQGSRLYELAADPGSQTFSAADLSRLAEHLTAPGISNFAYQTTREPCLWSVTREGGLLSFHYSRGEQIAAWARHDTEDGLFRDVVIFPSDSGDDEIFFIIDREDGAMLERFPQSWQATQEAGTVGNYVDAAGMTGGDFAVVSELQMLPVDLSLDGGTTHGRRKRCNEILLSVYQSQGGTITYDGENLPLDYEADTGLATKWISLTMTPGYVVDLQPEISHSEANPFTVRAAIMRWLLHEP